MRAETGTPRAREEKEGPGTGRREAGVIKRTLLAGKALKASRFRFAGTRAATRCEQGNPHTQDLFLNIRGYSLSFPAMDNSAV